MMEALLREDVANVFTVCIVAGVFAGHVFAELALDVVQGVLRMVLGRTKDRDSGCGE